MNGHSLSFFNKYKDLYEFTKYVGAEALISNGTKSFLNQYHECDAEQDYDLAITPQMGFMFSTIAANPTSPAAFSLSSSFAVADREVASPSENQIRASNIPYSFATPQLSSLHGQCAYPRNSNLASLRDLNMTRNIGHDGDSRQTHQTLHAHQFSSATLPRLRSPVRHKQPNEQYALPKLSNILTDHGTPAAVAQHTRLDVTQKIELLTGSKCLGRISSESNNLPPSIRKRLQASSNVHHRREKLYTLLSQDYAELADLHTR